MVPNLEPDTWVDVGVRLIVCAAQLAQVMTVFIMHYHHYMLSGMVCRACLLAMLSNVANWT